MKTNRIEHPRLVAIETTNRCNAKCEFCPNNRMSRDRLVMDDELFEKIIDDCRSFPLGAIEPFLNGEPFVDPRIMDRLLLIRQRLPKTRLRLYTNGYGLTPKRIDGLLGLGVDHLYVSLNTLDPEAYRRIMGLDLERTLSNLAYLTEPQRKPRVARKVTFRMTRTDETTLKEQEDFIEYCRRLGVRSFIVGLFNYKGAIPSHLPVPPYPCEHITRIDVLSSGIVTLCCMDHEGEYAWGDARKDSILDIYNGPVALRYRTLHRQGRRHEADPCGHCNVFWPSLERVSPLRKAQFAVQIASYFLRFWPTGKRA
ncbi:MAG: radical SAM protein [Deltaproteobacteria bacterium]|nr:radical SAM protein [Deltaproteobacteria bacterium]